jgi:uncharacterized protein YjbI with pentapeptide repeats
MTTPNLAVKRSTNIFIKPLEADFRELFKALGKGLSHAAIGKWDELGTDAVDALAALGLSTDPGEVMYLLLRRSATRAIFDLLGEVAKPHLLPQRDIAQDIQDKLDYSINVHDLQVDTTFFDRPATISIVNDLQVLFGEWLILVGFESHTARAVANRLPAYFVYALNKEWRSNPKAYRLLVDAVDTPFIRAGEREWSWNTYASLLQRRAEEGVFDEPFSLTQIYVPLRAYHAEDSRDGTTFSEDVPDTRTRRRKLVVDLEEELLGWLNEPSRYDAIRVLSGGPGSGKSSFARIFAATVAEMGRIKVLFVPLHLIDPSRDLTDEVGRFVADEGVLLQNPLDPDSPETNLLIVFDGLDELANQGKAAAETARAFIREIERTVEKRNAHEVRLRVLLSGRELVIQENEAEFRRPRQILNLLPYHTRVSSEHENEEDYVDSAGLLNVDLRDVWWSQYGLLTGKGYNQMPSELARRDLDEITAQPLLNYLVALSYTRGSLDFTRDVNLNEVYNDLVAAVHERAYEKGRTYIAIKHMKQSEFFRVLEEIGLAAWHGDGRTTTVREIEEHCKTSGVTSLLSAFAEGAKAGVTRLLAAFFFRQYGRRASGDPTFIFTHKSFGEYLAARRVVRAMERVTREREGRDANPDQGWDEREALKHWAQVCGPGAMNPYLHAFLVNEVRLRPLADTLRIQGCLTDLFGFVLRHGTPMEMIQSPSFRVASFQARNAEEALLAALNACARHTEQVSSIKHPEPTAFGAWLRRIQGQRSGGESSLASTCLSYLDLSNTVLHISDLYGADLSHSDLVDSRLSFACLSAADLVQTDFRGAKGSHVDFSRSNLNGANFEGAEFMSARFEGALMRGVRLTRAMLLGSDLRAAKLEGAVGLSSARIEDELLPPVAPVRKKQR